MEIFDYKNCKGTFTVIFLDENEKKEYSINMDEKSLGYNLPLAKSVIEHEEGEIYELKVNDYVTKIKLLRKNIVIKKIVKRPQYYICNISNMKDLNDIDIYYKFEYKAWEKYICNTISYKIIYALKNNIDDSYKLFAEFLHKEVFLKYNLQNYILAMVPSHCSAHMNQDTPMAKIIDFISDKTLNYNGKNLLIRYETIEAQKNVPYIDRNKEIHFESIIKNKDIDIKGKSVIILDDIVTSGNSIDACRDILINNGASKVLCFAFSKAIRRSGDEYFKRNN